LWDSGHGLVSFGLAGVICCLRRGNLLLRRLALPSEVNLGWGEPIQLIRSKFNTPNRSELPPILQFNSLPKVQIIDHAWNTQSQSREITESGTKPKRGKFDHAILKMGIRFKGSNGRGAHDSKRRILKDFSIPL
jgi:hypothetical protein